jgi:hypothetical protein
VSASESIVARLALTAALGLLTSAPALAQLNGQNIKGDAGLKSGSQGPPGVYFAIPLWFYTADAVKDRNGDEFLTGNLDAALFGVALNVVTTRKVLGANYGFLVVLPWANNRIQGVEDFDSNPGAGLTDMFIQPIDLGWHLPRADITAAYGLYVPTGRYEDGADNNTGLGMWAQEILLGTTVYLNDQRTLHAAATASFDFQSEKKDSTTRVGNIMNLEGGVGADFVGGGLSDRGESHRLRLRHGALPVGAGGPHHDGRRGVEHPGDLPPQAHSPAVITHRPRTDAVQRELKTK